MSSKTADPTSFLSSPLDSKIYLIFALISLILLFYNIWEIKPVEVDVEDFLGLIPHLTIAYWIGYVSILFFSIKLYFDENIKKDYIYLIYLIVIGLFLFGVPIFAEENARYPWTYYPAGEVKTVLETKYIDTFSKDPLITYRSWPATHLISATLLYFINIKIENLLKYMPLFWLFSIIFLTFSTGKRLRLLSNQSFFATFLFLTSFWLPHYYYGPQSFAYILYILLFMLIISFNITNPDENIIFIKDKMRNTLLIVLTFTTLVITHILTPIAVISSFIFSSSFIRSLSKKRAKFIILFLILFIGWYAYIAPVMFEAASKEIVRQVMQLEAFNFLKTEKYSTGTLLTRQIIHYSRLFYLGIYAIAMITASTLYLTGRIKVYYKERTKICFYWLVGILALFALKYGAEIDDRIYIFSLVPMVYIISFVFDKKILALLAILLLFAHMPAHYGTESFDLIRTTELNGAEFFAAKSVFYDSDTYFSMWDTFIDYYDPEKVKIMRRALSVIEKPDPSEINNSTYIINSNGGHNFIFYSFGFDPLKEWIQLNQGNVSLFYDNGNYQIYKNSK